MYTMYGIIESLCRSRGIKVGRLCAELGISRGIMGDLKAGRTRSLSAEKVQRIAGYFGVSADYLLTGNADPRPITDQDLKFALWGDADIDDQDLADVRRYAEFLRQRRQTPPD